MKVLLAVVALAGLASIVMHHALAEGGAGVFQPQATVNSLSDAHRR